MTIASLSWVDFSHYLSISNLRRSLCFSQRILGIGGHAELGDIETFKFSFCRHSQRHDGVDQLESDLSEAEGIDHAQGGTAQLQPELG